MVDKVRKPRMVDVDEVIETPKVVEQKLEDNFFPIDDLPSRYKLYPEGTKIFGRSLKVSEVKKLTTMNENNFNAILKDILTATLRGIDIDDICVADKVYIIFWLRANTFRNSNFVAKYTCEHCETKNEYKFDLDSFDIEYLPEDYDKNEFDLLNSDKKLTLDILRIRDENKVKAFQENLKNSFGKIDDEVLAMASTIKFVDGSAVSLRQACEFIQSLENDPEDYAYLHSKILEMDFGVIPEIKHVCKKCSQVNKIPVSFRPEFFLPRYKF